MTFVAHTAEEIAEMLSFLECKSIDDLFAEIPKNLQVKEIDGIPERMTEAQVSKLLQQRAVKDRSELNFIGAGCYEHYVPAAVWDLVSRGEFLTSYTPYQAEASQGTLQVLYEFQSMFASLSGLQVSNASLYDGATALAEAILMAARCNKKANPSNKKVLIPLNVHPYYRQVVQTIIAPQQFEIINIDYDLSTGKINQDSLKKFSAGDFFALVIPQPNFLGILDDVNFFTDWAHANGALAIGLVNPMSLGFLAAPGNWGERGVDIACGEAQVFGVPLSSGGPYIGFLCARREYIRQLPGRLVGMTTDRLGQRGFTLTLQAREQHIRRSKATSNICTNQGLLATAVTIYLSLMGCAGIRQVALTSHANTTKLRSAINKISGFTVLFDSPYLYEIVVQAKKPVAEILDRLAAQGIQGGFNLEHDYPELGNAFLCCATETKSEQDIDKFVEALTKC